MAQLQLSTGDQIDLVVRDGGLMTIRDERAGTVYGLVPVFEKMEENISTLVLAVEDIDKGRGLQAVRQIGDEPLYLPVGVKSPLTSLEGFALAYGEPIDTEIKDFLGFRRANERVNLSAVQDYALSGADTCCVGQGDYTVCATVVHSDFGACCAHRFCRLADAAFE